MLSNEQAIEVLHELDGSLYETQQIASDLAIKALEQQPSEDCVSRAEVDKLINLYLKNPTIDDSIAFYEHFLDLPPVTPTRKVGKWIIDEEISGKIYIHCSACGEDPLDFVSGYEDWWIDRPDVPKHCPFCGSRNELRGAENE